jgi:hypothetical protein
MAAPSLRRPASATRDGPFLIPDVGIAASKAAASSWAGAAGCGIGSCCTWPIATNPDPQNRSSCPSCTSYRPIESQRRGFRIRLSLRGAKRWPGLTRPSNPAPSAHSHRDCFASLAMTAGIGFASQSNNALGIGAVKPPVGGSPLVPRHLAAGATASGSCRFAKP